MPARRVNQTIRAHFQQHGAAAGETHHELDVVVHLGREDAQQMRVHADDLLVRKQLHHLIEQMHAPVQQHAAAIELVSAPAVHGLARPLHLALDKIHMPQQPLLLRRLHNAEILVPAAVLMDGKDLARLVAHSDNFLQFRGVERYRLFADDVFSRAKRGDGQLPVKVVRYGHGNQIDRRIGQQRVERIIRAQPHFTRSLQRFLPNVVRAADFNLRYLFHHVAGMPASHAAESNYSQAMFCHTFFLLCRGDFAACIITRHPVSYR